mmetsp:Transcript_23362/g.43931  ORF Transcript_23362/g.43931 Transcript_23362/m.43931 type:complete len:102 (+) Transcript_23362:1152-1457(+)
MSVYLKAEGSCCLGLGLLLLPSVESGEYSYMSTRRTIERRRRKASAACASIWRLGFGFGLLLWLLLCLLDDGLGTISGRREEGEEGEDGEDGEDGTGFEAL